ncbi:MAG: polysaccharide pyruvyl transferase family protein [Cyclobacteriaceae bacterium]
MKILIKGYYGFGNLGDDILMTTTYHLLKNRFPAAELFIFSNFTSNLNGFNRQPNYNKYIWHLLGEEVQIIDWTYRGDFDLIVDGGGGVYFDYSIGSSVWGLLNAVNKFMGVTILYRIDVILRKVFGRKRHLGFKRRAGFGLGIGPYSNSSRLLYQHLVEIGSTNILFVRDNTSLKLLQAFRFSGIKDLSSDIAFLSQYWLNSEVKQRPGENFQNRIGIILLDWHEGNDSRFEEFQKFADHLIVRGTRVTFFSFDENHDIKYIRKFQEGYSLVVWRPNEISISDFLNTLSAQDILFSARAHGVIIGSILKVPSICIATSQKLIEVSRLLPLSTSLVNEPIQEEQLFNQLENVQSNYSERLKYLDLDIERNEKLAIESWLEFSKHL